MDTLSIRITPSRLTDDQVGVVWEAVCRNFEVERRWALSYASGDIVM